MRLTPEQLLIKMRRRLMMGGIRNWISGGCRLPHQTCCNYHEILFMLNEYLYQGYRCPTCKGTGMADTTTKTDRQYGYSSGHGCQNCRMTGRLYKLRTADNNGS